MTAYSPKDYMNHYDSGQAAVDRGDYRIAYDCFMACLEYKKEYEPWDESAINKLEYLVEQCAKAF